MSHAIVFEGCNDQPYLDWLNSNPEGYVLNTNRSKSGGYLVLHRAWCGSIRPGMAGARSGAFTSEYIKVCATAEEALEAWARTIAYGGKPRISHGCYCLQEQVVDWTLDF